MKKPYHRYQKPSDKFWRNSLMRILNCLQNEELTWSRDNWQKYGVSIGDQKRIEQEFYRLQNQNKLDSVGAENNQNANLS